MKISDDAYLNSATSIFIAVRLPELRENGLAGDELAAACVRGIAALHFEMNSQYEKILGELRKGSAAGSSLPEPLTVPVPTL